MNFLSNLQSAFLDYITKKWGSSAPTDNIDFILQCTTGREFGDIATNCAMVLARPLKQNPQEIARTIQREFSHPAIARLEIAGPGFINFFLTDHALVTIAQELFLQKNTYFKLPDTTPRIHFNIEYVSANPTGPLHLGHGRGGIIGDVLSNVLKFVGHTVTREFYINDAGSQIDILGASFKARCAELLGQTVVFPENGYQGDYLIPLAQRCVEEHGAALLEKPDSFFAEYAKTQLLHHIQQVLTQYGITFDTWFSEKTLHTGNAIHTALKLLEQQHQTYINDGALWFKSTQYGDDKDRVLVKSDGELTYAAADIAYIQNKLQRGAQKLIYILGQDHHSYVTRLKGFMQALGNRPEDLQVIVYQLVTLLEDGEALRMSKRAGRMITLEDIINLVGTDVARFFYLQRKSDAHLEFDLAKAAQKTDENPVYYLQYAYVRARSILEKAPYTITIKDTEQLGAEEWVLIKKIASGVSLLHTIARTYSNTHLLTYYTLELAHTLHAYYASCRVIDQHNESKTRARLLAIQLVREQFERCLELMGISCPSAM